MTTYYKSQLIPNDRDTTVYWSEDDAGIARDILPEHIPDGAIVIDADEQSYAGGTNHGD